MQTTPTTGTIADDLQQRITAGGALTAAELRHLADSLQAIHITLQTVKLHILLANRKLRRNADTALLGLLDDLIALRLKPAAKYPTPICDAITRCVDSGQLDGTYWIDLDVNLSRAAASNWLTERTFDSREHFTASDALRRRGTFLPTEVQP